MVSMVLNVNKKVAKPTKAATGVCYCNQQCPCLELKIKNDGINRARYCKTNKGSLLLPDPVHLAVCLVWAESQAK